MYTGDTIIKDTKRYRIVSKTSFRCKDCQCKHGQYCDNYKKFSRLDIQDEVTGIIYDMNFGYILDKLDEGGIVMGR